MLKITRVSFEDGVMVERDILLDDFYIPAPKPQEFHMSDFPTVEEAIDRFQASQALEELKRRHPEWGDNPACPDCGSFAHFECGGRV